MHKYKSFHSIDESTRQQLISDPETQKSEEGNIFASFF